MDLKGKKVYDVKKHTHRSYFTTTGIDITFDDGTVLHISAYGQGDIRTEIRKGNPPKKKVHPWVENEKAMFAKLTLEDQKRYKEVKGAFFWIIENRAKVENFYTYTDKVWEQQYKIDGKRKQFYIQINMDENDPEDILTIFMSSNIAPECDNWLRLGRVKDWERILEVYKDVRSEE